MGHKVRRVTWTTGAQPPNGKHAAPRTPVASQPVLLATAAPAVMYEAGLSPTKPREFALDGFARAPLGAQPVEALLPDMVFVRSARGAGRAR